MRVVPLGKTTLGFEKKLMYAPESSIQFADVGPPALDPSVFPLGTVGEAENLQVPAVVCIRGQASFFLMLRFAGV